MCKQLKLGLCIGVSVVVLLACACMCTGEVSAGSRPSPANSPAGRPQFSGTTYYVSSVNGNDADSGTSAAQAWKTLKAVNSRTFSPGDKILFERGTQYTGRLVAHGSGAEGFPIIVDAYAEGSKPRIDGDSLDMEAVLLYNVQYWEINNLEITNRIPQVPDLAGVRVHIENFGKARHIYLRNLYVHDIDGPHTNALSETGYGIFWENEGDTVPSVFDDLRVENCHVKNVNCRGIQSQNRYNRTKNWHPNLNVVIRNNLVEQIGGAGITTLGTEGCLIEYNRVDGIGLLSQGNGIHPYKSDNTVIQYNEVSDCRRGKTEGWGFNSDNLCNNSLFQYNYSHDNEGGFQLVIGEACRNTVVRYNISQNDGFSTTNFSPTFNLSKNCTNTRIYNNTIYVGTKREPIELVRFFDGGTDLWPDGTRFYNNIFYVDGAVTFIWGSSTNNVFSNNVWYGKFIGPPNDPCGIYVDPCLVNVNSGGSGLNSLAGYKLQANSPCIGAGTNPGIEPDIYKNGGRDFWGNPVPTGITNPDIGAHQRGKLWTGIK